MPYLVEQRDLARRHGGLVAHEWLFAALGAASVCALALFACREPFPPLGPLALLCALSILSERYYAPADASGSIAASAHGMVVAAAAFTFQDTSPVAGAFIVGMAAAFWRVPRDRHQTFTLFGNLAVYGLPAMVAASLLTHFDVGSPNTLQLVALTVPLVGAYALVNAGLVAWCIFVSQKVPLVDASRELWPHLPGAYIPSLFGAVVGE